MSGKKSSSSISRKIFEGCKTVELRRRFPKSLLSGAVAYIYASSPAKAMVGFARVDDIQNLPVEEIWARFGGSAAIGRDKFDRYFAGLQEGYALIFKDAQAFSRPVPLAELYEKSGFAPSQSFRYTSGDLIRALKAIG